MPLSVLRASLLSLSLAGLAGFATAEADSRPQPGAPLQDIYTWLHSHPELSFKESWALLQGKVIRFWIAVSWFYCVLRLLIHYTTPHQALGNALEIIGDVFGAVAYAFVYKELIKKR